MSRIEHLSQVVAHTKQHWKMSLLKGLLAASSIILITGGVRFIFRSDALIYSVSWLDLLVIIALAILFGRAMAVVAAVTAFMCLDFFFVWPLYTLQIKQSGDALTLVIFLLVAVSMCLCVSEVRRRYYKIRMSLALEKQKSSEEAAHRARPVRILYDTAKKTSREKTLDAQLSVIAQAVIENFQSHGIHCITIFLPDKEQRLCARASWPQTDEVTKLLDASEVRHTAEYVIAHNKSVEFTIEGYSVPGTYGNYIRSIVAPTARRRHSVHLHACMKPVPLIDGKRAALFLLLDDPEYAAMLEQGADWEGKDQEIEAWFLWQFIEHMVALIEKARLQDEKLRLEIMQRTENLHVKLIKWVSHGIRTPLTSFLLETEKALAILQHEESANDDIRIALESMKGAVCRLDHFVDDFLDMTRAKGGILKPQKSLNYIDDLLDEALEGLQPAIANRHIERDIPDDLPPLELDPMQIGHVLTNLIENALRYTPLAAPIEIRAHTCKSCMRIEVADRGPGVLPSDKDHIFDEFYRGKAVAAGGKGLGLPTCKALVEAHEGMIGHEDREGGGAIFYFTLPLICERQLRGAERERETYTNSYC